MKKTSYRKEVADSLIGPMQGLDRDRLEVI